MIDITLLTQPSCIYCDRAKEILSHVAMDFAIEIREIDLGTADGRRLAFQHAVMFAPGILIDGNLLSYGRLSEKKLRSKLTQVETKRKEG